MKNPSELRDRLRFATFTGASGARYQVRELLGEGGQGWVFKAAQDDAGGPPVVVKVLRPDLAGSEAFARFEREATVLRALSSGPSPHPHIVRFFEHGRATIRGASGTIDVPYLVLEYVDGPPLRKVLAAHGGFGLPVARVRRLLRQVARALADLHAQAIVHRDLKPSNILLSQSGASEIAKVTDFGLVKLIDQAFQHTVTVAGASAGYAPPEQYEVGNRRVGPATDVFSFGAVLYESLSGCEAFPVAPGDSALRLVARMLGDDRPALARVSATIPRELRDRPDLTAALDKEIARATDGDPAKRHPTIQDLWFAVEPLLRAATSGGSHASSAPSAPSKPSEPPPTSAIADSGGRARPAASSTAPSPPSRAPESARILGKPMTGERLRGAAFADDASSLVAIGAYGMYRFANGVWSALRAPRGVDAKSLRGVARAPSGELLLFGDGCAALQSRDGASRVLETGEPDAVWLGALADAAGIVLVGERRSAPRGLVCHVSAGGSAAIREAGGTSRLHAVTRTGSGALLVCGSHGALFLLEGDDVLDIPWGRTGHLYAAAPSPDGGAFVVGSGGHALAIDPPLPLLRGVPPAASLEAVQTTRDLTAVAVDAAGTAWGAGAQGRLLVRRAGTWSRVAAELGANLVAVAPRPASRAASTTEVVALAEDGTVVEVAAP